MHQGLTRLPAIRWIVFRKLATTTKSLHELTQGPLSTNDMRCFPFSVVQSPVWSIVNLLDGESTTVTTKKMQELFVVRKRYFSSFRGNVGKFVLLDSKKMDGMKGECHASGCQVDITSSDSKCRPGIPELTWYSDFAPGMILTVNIKLYGTEVRSLHWRHNGHDGVSNHQPHDCLLNRLFRRRSKKASKPRVTGLCVGNSPGPVKSPHKGPVTRKMFPFDDVIMDLEI